MQQTLPKKMTKKRMEAKKALASIVSRLEPEGFKKGLKIQRMVWLRTPKN